MLTSVLGKGNGLDIYVSISQNNGLELMIFDQGSGIIKEYAQEELDYNDSSREIANYNGLQAALESALNKKGINPAKANFHFNLPVVWFAQKEEIPLILQEENITNLVIDELEQTYLFRSKDPIPYWYDNVVTSSENARNIFYSAVQKEAVEQISDVVARMGGRLASVGCSLISNIRGLKATGLTANQMMSDDCDWTLIIINSNGYQLTGMKGSRMADYFEEALPLKSFEGDEVYMELENAMQIALMSTSASTLVILSETDLVSAEVLAGRLQFTGNTIAIENNQFKKEQLPGVHLENLIPEDKLKISLQAIGTVAPTNFLPMDINFIAGGVAGVAQVEEVFINVPIGNDQYMKVTPKMATTVVGLIALVVLGGLFGASTMLAQKVTETQATIDAKEQELTQINEEKAQYSGTETGNFDAVTEIEKVLKANRLKVMTYAALGESVPKKLYLTYFNVGNDGLINIRGCASAVEDVYVFFKNLKDSLASTGTTALRISKLDLKSASLDDIVNTTVSPMDDSQYIFEITNMSESELQLFNDFLSGKKPPEKDASSEESNSENSEENSENGGEGEASK